eukprot:7277616-Ditylum_brightwellii.AAC.1
MQKLFLTCFSLGVSLVFSSFDQCCIGIVLSAVLAKSLDMQFAFLGIAKHPCFVAFAPVLLLDASRYASNSFVIRFGYNK